MGDVEAVGHGEGVMEVSDMVEVEEDVVREVDAEGDKTLENLYPYWLVEGRQGEGESLSFVVLVDTFLLPIVEVLVDTVALEGRDGVFVDFEIKTAGF